jgi:hypothetical protein
MINNGYRRALKQSGAALLALLLVLVTASSYMLVTRLNESARLAEDYAATMKSLNLAKRALIGYAVTYHDVYSAGNFGILPCPETNSSSEEGNQSGTCGSRNVNSLGMLPWQTLGLSPLKDGNGQCLWYAVSGAFKGGSTKAEMVNEDSTGTFQIIAADGSTVLAGSTAASRPAAVIIAPGRALSHQSRAPAEGTICGNDYGANQYLTASAYLDAQYPDDPDSGIMNYSLSGTADAVDQFIQASDLGDEDFNDVMVYITADDIFNAVKTRADYDDKLYVYTAAGNLTRLVAECLAAYAIHVNTYGTGDDDRYVLPWPAPLTVSDYRDSDDYTDYAYTGSSVNSGNNLSGRVPIVIDDTNNELSITAGQAPDDNLIDFCIGKGVLDADDKKLWENWKDHLYYALGEPFQPIGTGSLCGQGVRCITMNYNYATGTTRDYAGVVKFSASALGSAGQARSESSDRATLSNYLENITGTNNTDNYVDGAGDSTKRYDYDGTISTARNDIYYCINDNDGTYDFDVCKCPTDASTTFNGAADCSLP